MYGDLEGDTAFHDHLIIQCRGDANLLASPIHRQPSVPTGMIPLVRSHRVALCRGTAPETVRTTLWGQIKPISMRFMHRHLHTILQE
jgi:hypothetical protein